MQVDRKAEKPVDQSDLDRIAETLRARDVQRGPLDLPKATFVFGPVKGERRSAIMTPGILNPSRIDVVHQVFSKQGIIRQGIEAAWVQGINERQGRVIFANDIGEIMRISRSGRVSVTRQLVAAHR